MYIFFLDFLHHYSQQRSAVRSTAQINIRTHITLVRNKLARRVLDVDVTSNNITIISELKKKKYGAHSHVHLLS